MVSSFHDHVVLDRTGSRGNYPPEYPMVLESDRKCVVGHIERVGDWARFVIKDSIVGLTTSDPTSAEKCCEQLEDELIRKPYADALARPLRSRLARGRNREAEGVFVDDRALSPGAMRKFENVDWICEDFCICFVGYSVFRSAC